MVDKEPVMVDKEPPQSNDEPSSTTAIDDREAVAKAIEDHQQKARRAAAANGFRNPDGGTTHMPLPTALGDL